MAPDWNWGYARGAAHDAAFELRQRLGRREDREKWIQDDSIPWDETVLCLALRIQRSCNYGRDAAGFGSVLDALAAGEYGSASAPNAALVGALSARLVEGLGQQEPGSDAEAIQRSLIALGFLEEGL
ncbi:hypothetical protein A3770_03p21490 [Chloropicon primus]|uniref:Uncharacterized protein n=1 Tax=Chloropicon primus TaxID=1764295 RepID=A0A5B8MH75_9CHLO|nr:hypothetical protein A3770_03p21490 [Chloropicon primus]|eukprot:QDZ19631.1 hypothetical protein A3770_03p21490 [Chloropicon primus]